MQTILRHIFFSLLVLVTAIPVISSVDTIWKQKDFKKAAFSKILKSTTVEICIPTSSLIWVEKNVEILHNGQMFDVVSFTAKGKFTYLKGQYDEKETLFLQNLETASASDRDLHFNIFLVFYPFPNYPSCNLPVENKISFSGYHNRICERYFSINHPPPKFLLHKIS